MNDLGAEVQAIYLVEKIPEAGRQQQNEASGILVVLESSEQAEV